MRMKVAPSPAEIRTQFADDSSDIWSKACDLVERNHYLESITKLAQIIQLDEAECLTRPKRGGIVEKMKSMAQSEDIG